MKVKYHKIAGIPIEVCSAEQKIAYNIAFRIEINHGDDYKKLLLETDKSAFLSKMIRVYLEYLIRDHPGIDKKYSIDGIFSALNTGLRDYMVKPFIAADYAAINKVFKAYYKEGPRND